MRQYLLGCTFILLQCMTTSTLAAPIAPKLSVDQNGTTVSVTWEVVTGANSYQFHFAPYPYTGDLPVSTIDMDSQQDLSANLWDGAAYYVAVTALDETGISDYSNIEVFSLGENHRPFASIAGSSNGLTLIAPLASTTTYLIDDYRNPLHQWSSQFRPGNSVYLLDNGSLLRTGTDTENSTFNAGGKGGYIEEFDWQGHLLWQFKYSDSNQILHHDIEPLPNGNILALVWAIHNDTWTEKIIEIEKQGTNSANILWQWDIWDHLTELGLDLGTARIEDWIHLNSIDYNNALNQIMINSRSHNKVWIIDRASGDLVTESSVGTTGQHDAQWVDPNDKNSTITLFDNGQSFSRVLEVDGNLETIIWEYGNTEDESFIADHISGATRLDNGNTLICDGVSGTIFEVNGHNNKIWEYISLFTTQTPSGSQNSLFRAEKYSTGYTPYF